MKRNLKRRPPIVVAPIMLSQLNCEPICGIDPRRFLDLVRRLGMPAAKVGKLLLVDADEFRRRVLATVPEDRSAPPVDLERQPETAEEVLAELGYELVR